MVKPHYWKLTCIILIVAWLSGGCQLAPNTSQSVAATLNMLFATTTRTPFQPLKKSPASTAIPARVLLPSQTPEPTAIPAMDVSLWVDGSVPSALKDDLSLPQGVKLARKAEDGTLSLGVVKGKDALTTWVYALVAPFPTLIDEVSLEELQQTWQGKPPDFFKESPLMMAPSTRQAIEALWGPPSEDIVKEVSEDKLLDQAWASRPAWAIVPFEALGPRWKVLRIDGLSPLERDFNPANYPLTVGFGLTGEPQAMQALAGSLGEGKSLLPASNRDPELLTVLVMTGTTALTRTIGAKMEAKGMTYPGEKIGDWLRTSDLTHISNEVSFTPDCPPANPFQHDLRFCSRPDYIKLLEDVGANIIELSGNHNLDWGVDPFNYSLDLYKQHDWPVFAGGENLAAARKPLVISNHGNKLAFIGCNHAGPPQDWATESTPGVASCDYQWMYGEIKRLKDEGGIPIVTQQYNEVYSFKPGDYQRRDFRALSEAGAAIVSGSQAHFPQGMDFIGDGFIHYGLGNLFFDQMDLPVVGTRREFIDRHIFYDGRYISTELLTAMLEDYSQPRPMTADERQQLLQDAFSASGW